MMMEEGTKRKNCKNEFFLSKYHFTPKIFNGGDLFSIPITNNSSIFLPNSVNHGLGLMCFKFKEILKYKQHPSS